MRSRAARPVQRALRTAALGCPCDSRHSGNAPPPSSPPRRPMATDGAFAPRRVLLLTKMTRLEYERKTNASLSESELAVALGRRGSDYHHLLRRQHEHSVYLKLIQSVLEKKHIETRVVQRWNYNEENIGWADAVMTAGGDGTFLFAASKIRSRHLPLIGINTDPVGSEGHMCLMQKEHADPSQFLLAIERLLNGDFSWLFRQRIRITLSGRDAHEDPIELHDQQLLHPEHRWSEHLNEDDSRLRSGSLASRTSQSSCANPAHACASDSPVFTEPPATSDARVLPILALNEVFIGESLSARVSYYMLHVDDAEAVKQKSSGLTVCTGTGSTSWYFNINRLTEERVADLIRIISDEAGVQVPQANGVVSRVCRRFNDQLVFAPSDERMAFTVRDQVCNATFSSARSRGFARRLGVQSRCFDAHLVVDGSLSYIFNDGSRALLEIHPEDALRTVAFRD